MTMLRIDAEENCAPSHVLTLTSRDPLSDAEWRRAWQTFAQALRRRWGRSIEYAAFVEWTTGRGTRSGGLRRMHVHALVKGLASDVELVQLNEWVSAEWSKLTGAWRTEVAELRHQGGVVGYLALHHEKWEQRPPDGWKGRRLRTSQRYFALSSEHLRQRARLWLLEHRATKAGTTPDELLAEAQNPAPRAVWRSPEWERDSRLVLRKPGDLATLSTFRDRDRKLLDPAAPIHADDLDRAEQDLAYYLASERSRLRRLRDEGRRISPWGASTALAAANAPRGAASTGEP